MLLHNPRITDLLTLGSATVAFNVISVIQASTISLLPFEGKPVDIIEMVDLGLQLSLE